jgi:methane/ammonia monooxygenase subunit B
MRKLRLTSRRIRRTAAVGVLAALTLLVTAAPALGHGEAAQEAFLRMRTIGWLDVQFSIPNNETLQQGDEFTITGTAKIMNTWPDTLAAGEPRIGFITVATAGPVVVLKERTVNGVSTPGRIEIERGQFYDFELTLAARRTGEWHVHPAFAVKGAGTLLGPGQFINVEENPDGFTNDIQLASGGGETINLEDYNTSFVWIWQLLTFLVGLGWMLYWTVPKFHRTVTNLAVTSQIPLNDDGVDVGLNSKRDHRVVNWFALATIVLLVAGWIYQANAFPVKIPQQVIQFRPPPVEAPPLFAEATAENATFSADENLIQFDLEVTNTGDSPMQLAQFVTSNLQFDNPEVEAGDRDLGVDPTGVIDPGETTTLQVAMRDNVFETEHLLPVGEAQLTIAGLAIFEDEAGNRTDVEIDTPIAPTFD